jgi:amino acid transporter
MTLRASDPDDHSLHRELTLRDLVFSQILSVVGSSWVGLAAGLGHAQTLVWIFSFATFYFPMAAAVYYLNREMPLEGGIYVWARRAFGDTTGFLVAWNVWLYGLLLIATVLFQLPSELAFMIGPSAAWIPENHMLVISAIGTLALLLALSAFRGLALGKWIHNISGISVLLAYALLIAAPFWAMLHHVPIHYTPLELHLPKRDLVSLALIAQILFASSGLEYVAIMAGESNAPSRDIGRSILIASPIAVLMFMLGTASVLAFHEFSGVPINYVAPIPQALRLAFGGSGVGTFLARFAILLLQIRIIGSASFIFTGVTRLPMTAGWDHLIPEWFSRLHPRYRTPTNSIFASAAVIALVTALASIGVHASEAFALLSNTNNTAYGIAYLVMFAIPICGAVFLRKTLPRWLWVVCAIGFLVVLFSVVLSAYPFLDIPSPLSFALKVAGITGAANIAGYVFYRVRRQEVVA